MNKADLLIIEVIKLEGGYVNHPHDHGLETKYGISKRSYPSLAIKELTIDEAIHIYKKDYYRPCKLGLLPPKIQFQILQMVVNIGVPQGIKILQHSANLTTSSNIMVDGIIGNETIKSIKAIYNNNLINVLFINIMVEQLMYYRKLVSKSNKQKVFLNGWINRIHETLKISSEG